MQPISFRDSVRWLSVSHHARDTKKALVSLFTPAPAAQLKKSHELASQVLYNEAVRHEAREHKKYLSPPPQESVLL